jgi:hypothetical protein
MQTTRTFPVAAVLVLSVCVSMAPAGAPMGPPTATLREGQWSVGGEFAREEADMEAFGRVVEAIDEDFIFFYAQPFTLRDFRSNMFFGTVAYGVCENWNVFVRLGAANARDDVILHPATSGFDEDRIRFNGNYGFAWGVGTRATFCRWGPWSVGGLAQVTWFDPGDDSFVLADPAVPDELIVGNIGIDYWQTQVSLAAMYQVDFFRFWAGPFLQFVRGDLDLDGVFLIEDFVGGTIRGSADIRESSWVGAHFGASWAIADQWNLWVEGQITSDSWLVGVGAVFVPEAFGF